MNEAVDGSFGIRYENGHFMMGDKILKIYGDNIMLDDEVYIGTLITDKSHKTYIKEDYERYKELTLKVLELTDQRNGINIIVQAMDCIWRKMDAAAMFEELVPRYISDHVLC